MLKMDGLYLLRLLEGEKLQQLLIEYLDPDTGIQNNYLVFFLSGQIDSQLLRKLRSASDYPSGTTAPS